MGQSAAADFQMETRISEGKNVSVLVAESGAMCGIFMAGVLDAFIGSDYLPFDFAIGVSAGSAILIGYLAGDHGRSRRILLDRARRADFINWLRYLNRGASPAKRSYWSGIPVLQGIAVGASTRTGFPGRRIVGLQIKSGAFLILF